MESEKSSFSAHYEDKSYEKISRGRRDGVLTLLGDIEGKSILDIGCANGAMACILKERATCIVTGIEISEEAAKEARKAVDRVFVFDIEERESWPKEIFQESFDKIICSEVMEHLFLPEKLLQAVSRIATPETDIVITVPNLLFWKSRLSLLAGNFEYTERGLMDRGHIHFFSWDSFCRLVRQEGFAIVATAHHVPTRGTQWLSKYFPGIFAHNFIVKLKKGI